MAMYLILALACLALPAAQTPHDPPNPRLDSMDKAEARLEVSTAAVLSGSVSWSIEAREVRIRWLYDSALGSRTTSTQTETVSFWPTSVAAWGTNRLAVAGKTMQSGRTIIEIWDFDAPSAPPQACISQLTGETVYPGLSIPVSARTGVYDVKAPGKELVCDMFRNLGAENSIFVQFQDSRDLYEIDTVTGRDTRLFCAAPGIADCSYLPGLADDRRYQFGANHLTWGYVYVFGKPPRDEVTPCGLLLADKDRDGIIDQALELVVGDWEGYGLSSSTQYID